MSIYPHIYATLDSPLGEIVLTSNSQNSVSIQNSAGLTGVYFPEHMGYEKAKQGQYKPKLFQQALLQFNEYFAGIRQHFTLPLCPEGTEFQKNVWQALTNIDYGKTKSYGEIASGLNNAAACRAVGLAISKNLLGIIVPCHRVIGANGKLTGFAGGLSAKQWLLDHEKSLSKAEKKK